MRFNSVVAEPAVPTAFYFDSSLIVSKAIQHQYTMHDVTFIFISGVGNKLLVSFVRCGELPVKFEIHKYKLNMFFVQICFFS